MYEKLDKLRADVERWKKRIEEDKNRLLVTQEKLREAEKTQILADVAALNLTPEQLAELLKPVADGALPGQGMLSASDKEPAEEALYETNTDEEDEVEEVDDEE